MKDFGDLFDQPKRLLTLNEKLELAGITTEIRADGKWLCLNGICYPRPRADEKLINSMFNLTLIKDVE